MKLVEWKWQSYPNIGNEGKRHVWSPMAPGTVNGIWSSTCQICGSTIRGAMGGKPTLADLDFQGILQDCDVQLVRRIMEA